METTTVLTWLTQLVVSSPALDGTTEPSTDYGVSTPEARSWSAFSSLRYNSSLIQAFNIILIAIAVVGAVANGYVLLALLFSKSARNSNVNVFIMHQTVLDLTACLFLFIGLMMSRMRENFGHGMAIFSCFVFTDYPVSVAAGSASVCGQVIITIERYFKIVHPVAYRNKYRPWMNRVGILIPWIFAVSMDFIPSMAARRYVNGRCYLSWPNNNMRLAWSVAKFLFAFLLPLASFIYGYGKILAVIRRQRNQVGNGQPQTGTTAVSTAERNSRRAEMNVIKTMILVSVMFGLCFVCTRMYTMLLFAKVVPPVYILFYIFPTFSYANRCVNPFIYATQYDVVKRWWKVKACRVIRGQQVEQSMSGSTGDGKKKHQVTTAV